MEFIGKKDEVKAKVQHEEEEKEESKDKRWGGGEVVISNVKMFDKNKKEKYIFEPEEPLTITFDVEAKEEQKDFVFGLAVYNSEGHLCYGTNTNIEYLQSKSISGAGKITVSIPQVNLVNGSYFLDLAVHKIDGYPYDYHHFQYSFKVASIERDVGFARIKHKWDFSKNIQFKDQK